MSELAIVTEWFAALSDDTKMVIIIVGLIVWCVIWWQVVK